MDSEYTKIFDLKEELPAPGSETEQALVQQLDQIAQKIKQVQAMGHRMSKEEMTPIYALMEEVEGVAMAETILGFIFMMLSEHQAMANVFERSIESHGPIPALVFYHALALKNLGRNQHALDQVQRLIGAGAKHYFIYMMAAELQLSLSQHRACVAMCNLAVYENQEEKLDPFIMMAQCFHHLGEMEQMLECFRRIERLKGPMALQRELGDLYQEYGEMYEKVKHLGGTQHG